VANRAGVIFYADIGLPLFGLLLLWARSDSASGSLLFRTQLPRAANP
jgi:hypothetical protein